MATFKKWTSTVLVNGQPEPNVKIYVYEPGSMNEITVYEDEGVTPITQPILTDSQGRYAFFVDVDAYPEIRLYLEKEGVDFSEANEDLDGVPVPGAGGGAGTFTELNDTPSNYVGRGGDVVVVKTTEDGIETQPWPVTGTVLNVFLSDDAADVGSYYYMYPSETGGSATELTSSSLSTGDDQLLWSFVTEAGEPGIDQLALGVYTATLFLKKTGNKDVRLYWKLFKRDTGGTETEILQSAVSDYLTTDNSQYLISGYLNEDQALDPTDRLVLKLYADVSGTGTDVTVTLTMEGDHDSRLAIHVLSSAFDLNRLSDVTISSPSDNQMLAYDAGSGKWTNQTPEEAGILASDGSVPLTGDWDTGGFRISNLKSLNFKNATTLTISSGAVTVSQSYHYVDTEGGASTDDLDTINGGTAGDILYLRSADSSRTVVIKHGTGNIVTPDGNDYSLDSTDKVVALLFDGTNWHLVGAAGGGDASTSVIVPGYYKGLDFQNADDEVQVDDCETAWTASASGVSTSVDTADYKEGSGSQKIEVSSTVSAGNILAYFDLPSSVDWSKHWGVRLWFKSSIALSNGQLEFALDDTTGMSSPIQGAFLPALDADTWYELTLYLDPTATGINSVVSIGLKTAEDLPACTLHIDDIRMVCSTHKVSVQPGAVAVRKVADDSWDEIKTVDSTLTGDIETSGLGGLESGDTLGTSKWYEVYVVFDSAGTPGILFNEADTDITWPSGITHYRLIGYVYRDADGNLRPFYQTGDICLWNSSYVEVLNTTSPASMEMFGHGAWSPIDVSSAVPPNARYVRLYVLAKGTGNTTDTSYWTINFAAHGLDSLGRDVWYGVSRVSLDVTETFYQSVPVPPVPVDDSMIGYLTMEVDALVIRATGYELDRRSL